MFFGTSFDIHANEAFRSHRSWRKTFFDSILFSGTKTDWFRIDSTDV